MTIDHMRREYGKGPLREQDVLPDPIRQFGLWFDEAVRAEAERWFEANAMTLATCDADGTPAARIVLLKGFDERGFVFYTNYASDKGRQLAANPRAALLFHWPPLERQVRITGEVTRVSREEAEAYFHRRPRNSQLGAAASRQSEVVESRDRLEERWRDLETRYEGREVPMPEQWGGCRLRPQRMEFWQGQRSRLHDRLLYTRQGKTTWKLQRLSP